MGFCWFSIGSWWTSFFKHVLKVAFSKCIPFNNSFKVSFLEGDPRQKSCLLTVSPLFFGNLYRQTDTVRQAELTKLFSSLSHLSEDERNAIEHMTQALTKKILHRPLSIARECARESRYERLSFLLEAMIEPKEEK